MPLVADVIASTRDHKPIHPAPEMEDLIKRSEAARVEVCDTLSSHYITMSAVFNDTVYMHKKVLKCLEDISTLDSRIKDEIIPSVEGSASEIGSVSMKWKEIKEELSVVEVLLNIHTSFSEFESALGSRNFVLAIENLNQVEDLLSDVSTYDQEYNLEIISALRDELCLKREDLIFQFGEVWKKFISFSEEMENGGKVVLTITDLNESEDDETLNHILSALNMLAELQRFIHSFGRNLLSFFIRPVLCDCKDLEISYIPASKSSIMFVNKSQEKSVIKDTVTAMKAIHWLQAMFEFLNKHFSKCTIHCEKKTVSLMSMLGDEIGEEFINLVLNNCLEDSVPSDRKDLKSFNEVQKKVEEFHNFLIGIGFYSQDRNSLVNFVSNVDAVYGNKTCVNLLTKARNLMTQPLDVTITVEPTTPEEMLAVHPESGQFDESAFQINNLSTKSFHLPRCQISESVSELVKVIYSTLDEACVSTPEFATRLFQTVRNILSIYWRIVPIVHAQALSSSPKYAALLHNNGVFLAHHAFILVHNYKNRLPISLKDCLLTTADLGYMIRNSECNLFLKAMQTYKSKLIEIIRKGAESFNWKTEMTSVNPFQVSIEECLEELRKLQNAWFGVLPSSVFTKAIGTLANCLVEDLLFRIINLEEISTDDAIGLINALTLLTNTVPSLFGDEDEAGMAAKAADEVRMWGKLNELIVVLGASLKDLNERWAGGKGPLAFHFTPGEVKHLIKAIFQNTERRAQLLAKIK